MLFAWPSVPIIVSPVPQIHPGSSAASVGGFWEKGKGTKWVSVSALEWQGIGAWQKYWLDHKEERALMRVPGWAKGKAS